MHAAPLGLEMNLVFGATKMPRLRRSEIADGPLAVVAAVGRPPHCFEKNGECGFLPKAATPRLEMKTGYKSLTGL